MAVPWRSAITKGAKRCATLTLSGVNKFNEPPLPVSLSQRKEKAIPFPGVFSSSPLSQWKKKCHKCPRKCSFIRGRTMMKQNKTEAHTHTQRIIKNFRSDRGLLLDGDSRLCEKNCEENKTPPQQQQQYWRKTNKTHRTHTLLAVAVCAPKNKTRMQWPAAERNESIFMTNFKNVLESSIKKQIKFDGKGAGWKDQNASKFQEIGGNAVCLPPFLCQPISSSARWVELSRPF